jgi:hypothetical protein
MAANTTGIVGLFLASAGLGNLSIIFAVISILFGILVIAKPNTIAYLVGFYFIITGLFALLSVMV